MSQNNEPPKLSNATQTLIAIVIVLLCIAVPSLAMLAL